MRVFLAQIVEKNTGPRTLGASLLIEIGEVNRESLLRGLGWGSALEGRERGSPLNLIFQDERFKFLHNLLLSREQLVTDE